ncbi:MULTISPECIES: HdeD family acid-resistance protein [unclassified Mycobacterium]|uniref:HdeD family acid-resistance protein n=1 Tax=unclassified Mycobacterium TaxID=2642494 RepID=UPI0029C91F3A|nr:MULTISPECIES: HdeD family acid-resistance protein [unclassified Mycobacterium]
MTIPAPPSMLPHLWKSAAVSGLFAIVLGIVVVIWTGTSITLAAIFFGVALLVTGIQQVFFAFTLRASTGIRVLLLISGAAALVLAVIALSRFYDAWRLLAIWIAVGFIFRGVATTVSAISDPTLPGRALNVVVGVITLIAGIVVMASPYDSLQILAWVVGFWLIAIGVMELIAAFAIRNATAPEPVDEPEVDAAS